MKKGRTALVVVLLLLVVAGDYYSAQQAASPSALVGDYAFSDGGPTLVQVTTEGGGYYVAFENNGIPGQQIPAIPMTMDDQTTIGGNSVNTELVGLKATQGVFMVFKMGPGFEHWGKTFTTGYGSYGGPYSSGVEVLYRKN
jgi:hypothetical protein